MGTTKITLLPKSNGQNIAFAINDIYNPAAAVFPCVRARQIYKYFGNIA